LNAHIYIALQPAVGPVHNLIDCEVRGAAFGTQSPVLVE
jgi:hypothetical protein